VGADAFYVSVALITSKIFSQMDVVLLRRIKESIKDMDLYVDKKSVKSSRPVTPAELLRRRSSHEASEWATLNNFQSVTATNTVSRIANFFGVS
jgi:hypothetical protein